MFSYTTKFSETRTIQESWVLLLDRNAPLTPASTESHDQSQQRLLSTQQSRSFAMNRLLQGVVYLATGLSLGQLSSSATETPELTVIDSQEVVIGTETTIYNEVVQPELKPQPVDPAPVQSAPEVPPTADELQALREWEAMAQVTMFLGVKSASQNGSTVIWDSDEGQIEFRTSIDFRVLEAVTGFETQTVTYMVFVNPPVIADEGYRRFQTVDQPSAFEILPGKPGAISAGTRLALTDLHRYYDANRKTLEEEYAIRMATQKVIVETEKKPSVTIINYFPIESKTDDSQTP